MRARNAAGFVTCPAAIERKLTLEVEEAEERGEVV
jgi:hypothetical protein